MVWVEFTSRLVAGVEPSNFFFYHWNPQVLVQEETHHDGYVAKTAYHAGDDGSKYLEDFDIRVTRSTPQLNSIGPFRLRYDFIKQQIVT